MAQLMGIDVGTSGCKALVLNEKGEVVAQSSHAYPSSSPQPGWSEQDPEDWWNGVQACLHELREYKIDAIGLTGQMHGATFLDSDQNIIRPAMLWNDQRTKAQCEAIDHAVGIDAVRSITANMPMTGFQIPKLLWLREFEPENYLRVAKLLLPKDYIAFKLTGEFHTEPSDASGTGVFDLNRRDWSKEMLEALEVPRHLLPECISSTGQAGSTPEGIAVFAGAGDQSANGIGTGIAAGSEAWSLSLGSSGVLFAGAKEPNFHPSGVLNCFAHADGRYLAMAVSLNCGTVINWLKETFYPEEDYTVLEKDVFASSSENSDLLFVPFLSGERCPIELTESKSGFVGRKDLHTRADLSRAVFEGITFNLLAASELLTELVGHPSGLRLSGGGAKSAGWVQMLANAFQMPLVKLRTEEGPAFGAAMLAGVGLGVWNSVDEAFSNCIEETERITPSEELIREKFERWKQVAIR